MVYTYLRTVSFGEVLSVILCSIENNAWFYDTN